MLTTNEYLNLEEYAFKSSPESCSGNSCFTDCTDLPSDEDFLQQLSSDLDIPLFLNAGEDEMSLLNSFFDKSPEEIMSEIVSPSSPNEKLEIGENFPDFVPEQAVDFYSEVKIEPSDSCSSSNKSISPIQSPEDLKFLDVKDEIKVEEHSPSGSLVNVPIHSTEVDSKLLFPRIQNRSIKLVPNPMSRKVPIQPKVNVCTPPKNKIVVLKNTEYKRNTSTPIVSPPPKKVVVLENITTVPIGSVAQLPTTTLNNSVISNCTSPPLILKGRNNLLNIDPKILKRHQRKIKNRESACLSRKKKKDYLTSLENKVRDLSNENQQLKLENHLLKERLLKYEGNGPVQKSTSNMKANIILCMFLFSVAFHLDYFRGPLWKNKANLIQADPPKVLDHHGRNLLWATDEVLDKNGSTFSPFSMCPALINQTESARLVLELEKWIGKPLDPKPAPPTVDATSVTTPKSKPLRKRKQRKYQTTFISSSVYNNHISKKLTPEANGNELQVFSPTLEQLYSEFFEAINRQDDTFYVVSFSDHHMLLPALHHNKTRRPKMSLIMPSMLPTDNRTQPSLVPLMQIDCEVLDTRLIQVRSGAIPQHLRNGNSTTYENTESVSKPSDTASNYTSRKAYKPYFIKPKAVAQNGDTDYYNVR